jgi:hypothetical protein
MFNKLASEACSLNKSSCLAPALGVTKFIIVTDMILVALFCSFGKNRSKIGLLNIEYSFFVLQNAKASLER